MASLNRVVLVGNLTRDPELRATPNGYTVANFGIAVNRLRANKQGEREADFFTIITWNKLADICGQYLKKGSPVAVEGRLQSRSWETAEGQKRSTVEVVADNVQFLSRANSPGDQDQFSQAASSQTTDNAPAPEPVGAPQSDPFSDLPDDDVPF